MDDLTISPPSPLVLSRGCEASRLQGQLLARVYLQIFPAVRRLLIDRAIAPPAVHSAPLTAHSHENIATAARAAGACA